jgi:hypothetical protein
VIVAWAAEARGAGDLIVSAIAVLAMAAVFFTTID